MLENEENRLDEATTVALQAHLAHELDGQLGRSTTAFRREILRERSQAVRPVRSGPPWWLGVIGGAMAASVTLLAVLPIGRTQPSAPTGPTNQVEPIHAGLTPVGTNNIVQMNQTIRSELYDGGTIVGSDGIPLRRIRRVNVQENHWRNEATGESVEQIVPTEDEILYELKTY